MDVTAMAQLFIPGVGAEAGVAKGSGSLNQGPSAPREWSRAAEQEGSEYRVICVYSCYPVNSLYSLSSTLVRSLVPLDSPNSLTPTVLHSSPNCSPAVIPVRRETVLHETGR